ncbi:hypothetical protein FSP39_006830 [Pinctada imbricata]|uniref:G-protein coupled receptors family 1 profile domain-containing protein n=1 Tax=Pinctada imbricata TaxID=66713 RepID=A0AA88XHX8_PINIB|nr:hypothetical protein FSP39_006830 [Pinctada imbricata]
MFLYNISRNRLWIIDSISGFIFYSSSFDFDTGAVAFLGNILVIFIFFKTRLYRRPVNWFILNLATSDLIVSFVGHPLSAISAFRKEWLFGLHGCYVYGFICYTCACNSIMTHALVSYFRYVVVCKQRFVAKVSLSVVMKTLLFIWTYSLFWTVTPLIGWSSYAPEPYNVTCSIAWYGQTPADTSYVWLCFIFVLGVPLAIMVYSYMAIHRHTVKMTEITYNVALPANISSRYLLDLERSVTRICLFMAVVFLITWSPYAIVSLIFALGYEFYNPAVLLPTLFAKLSCAYNPFIYCYTHDKFRETLKSVFTSSSSKNAVGVAKNEELSSSRPGPSGINTKKPNRINAATFKAKSVDSERTNSLAGRSKGPEESVEMTSVQQ